MMQVMLNLLSNAVKFCEPTAGRVDVRPSAARRRPSGSTCRTTAPASRRGDQDVIFEKFRQGGDTLRQAARGTGLGLPISREIIEHFGGRIWVDSAARGRRARFSFTLPMPRRRARLAAADDGEQMETLMACARS